MKTVTTDAAEAVCVWGWAAYVLTGHVINYVGAAATDAGILADTVLIPSSLTVLTARATGAEARSRYRREPVLAARGEEGIEPRSSSV